MNVIIASGPFRLCLFHHSAGDVKLDTGEEAFVPKSVAELIGQFPFSISQFPFDTPRFGSHLNRLASEELKMNRN